jgi:Plasma-membrane choline transporter
MQWDNVTRYVWIYHLFGLFWVSAFIIGCAQFIIAATCCLWYFTSGGASDDKNRHGLGTGIKWLLRYHVGSIAFGALIIAIMQMIKVLFEYMRKKYEKMIGNNACLKCLICCIGCCVSCID